MVVNLKVDHWTNTRVVRPAMKQTLGRLSYRQNPINPDDKAVNNTLINLHDQSNSYNSAYRLSCLLQRISLLPRLSLGVQVELRVRRLMPNRSYSLPKLLGGLFFMVS
jgi:hypothetical protein